VLEMDWATWGNFATDFAMSGCLSAAAYGTAGFISAAAYTSLAAPFVGATMLAAGSVSAAPFVGVAVVGAGAAIGGHYAYEWAIAEVKVRFYDVRPMDPEAEMLGRLLGSVGGGAIGVQLGYQVGDAILFSWRYPDYETYEKFARGLTEEVFASNRAAIDPLGVRGKDFHLDHITSVWQGWQARIYPEMIAAPGNLQILTALENIRKGVGPPVVKPLTCSLVRVACLAGI
jgi:hypothetical protein